MRQSKECIECGGIYFRAEGVSDGQWEARRYCSAPCAGKAGARRLHGPKKAEGQELEPEGQAEVDRSEDELEKRPIMRELRIVRVGPNPRLVVCEYFELATRRTCTVLVKRTQKYVRGMRFRLAEPVSESEFRRPWVYSGPAPRHRGRW